MPEAFPAVTTPSFLKYGGSFASASRVVPGRMCSSAAQAASCRVFRSLQRDGHHLVRERARVPCAPWRRPGSGPRSSPPPRGRCGTAPRAAPPSRPSRGRTRCPAAPPRACPRAAAAGPSRSPQRAPRTTCGAWLIDSVPPASTTPASPSRICWAPWMTASKPEPQSRFTVTAGSLDRQSRRAGRCGGRGRGRRRRSGARCRRRRGRRRPGSTPARSSAALRRDDAQVGGGAVLERAAERAEAGTHAGEKDDCRSRVGRT